MIDNESRASENMSVMGITSNAIPGLLRSVAWTLNGMDIIVKEASITTNDEDVVQMVFACTEMRGSGSKQGMIQDTKMISDRLYDYLAFCTAKTEESKTKFSEDGVVCDNEKNKATTFVRVRINEKASSVISLYPIGSAFTGLGLIVKNGTLVSKTSADGSPIKSWEFEIVRAEDRKKLTPEELRALMYTLSIVTSSDPNNFGTTHKMNY